MICVDKFSFNVDLLIPDCVRFLSYLVSINPDQMIKIKTKSKHDTVFVEVNSASTLEQYI